MGILDDAIREHLELKRQHGADESVLKQLEGEAFGPSERPGSEADSAAQADAPTQFMQEPDLSQAEVSKEGAAPPSADVKPPDGVEETRIRRVPGPEIGDLQEGPQTDESEAAKAEGPEAEEAPVAEAEPEVSDGETEEAVQEEAPAMEHEAISDTPDTASESSVAPEGQPGGPEGSGTEERQAIADHPTELYDVEGEEFGPGEDVGAEEDFASEAIEEDEEDFFDEKRLSDELDEALDAPLDGYGDEPEPPVEQTGEPQADEELVPDEATSEPAAPSSHEDLLEETPEFLEETPEDDQLWFEQKPPKDFDFDD